MRKPINPQGRLDVLAFRAVDRYLLPAIESATGVPGMAGQLRPYAEAIVAEIVPPTRLLPFKPPRPRRRLCT